MIDFDCKIQKKWKLEHWFHIQEKLLFKTSEVDQELECEMHQTFMRNGEPRETYL
jgi:hypothetical protein